MFFLDLGKNNFRTLAHLELEGYLELWYSIFRTRRIFRPLSNISDRKFCKNSYLVHFPASVLKTFLYFEIISCISGNGVF